jgi:NADH-quinone oxidoreductase subunit L
MHHEQDMRKMGGLRGKLPITFFTLLAGALAIAGFPFSGWYSKEAILSAAHGHAPWMFWVAVLTAMMTAFYVFRTIWLTFFGAYKGHAHPHESPAAMWVPFQRCWRCFSVAGGFLFNVPHFLEGVLPAHEHGHDLTLEIIGSAAGLAGIALSYLFYVARPRPRRPLRRLLRRVCTGWSTTRYSSTASSTMLPWSTRSNGPRATSCGD